jgi:hypothetical protein
LTDDEKMALIGKHVSALAEHFANVQIMVSWNEDGNTRCARQGAGDWYARQGMAHEFISMDRARDQADQIRGLLEGQDE